MAQDEWHFTIIPVRLEKKVAHGDHRLSIFQQYDFFDDWEGEIDKLAVYLGGEARASVIEKEERSEEEKLIDGLWGKADAAIYAEEYGKALQFFEVIISMDSEFFPVWYNKAIVLNNLDRDEEALEAYDEALQLNPEFTAAWYNKAVLLNDLGRYDEALEAYDEALQLNPEDADIWSGKGVVLGSLGRHEEALEAFEKARIISKSCGWIDLAAILSGCLPSI